MSSYVNEGLEMAESESTDNRCRFLKKYLKVEYLYALCIVSVLIIFTTILFMALSGNSLSETNEDAKLVGTKLGNIEDYLQQKQLPNTTDQQFVANVTQKMENTTIAEVATTLSTQLMNTTVPTKRTRKLTGKRRRVMQRKGMRKSNNDGKSDQLQELQEELNTATKLPAQVPPPIARGKRGVTQSTTPMPNLRGSGKTLNRPTQTGPASRSYPNAQPQESYSKEWRSRLYADWTKNGWVTETAEYEFFSFHEGVVTIKKPGIYFVYAQITYIDADEIKGYHIFKNEDTILQCTLPKNPRGSLRKKYACFTAGATYLAKGDKIALADFSYGRNFLCEPGMTFFGVFKLGKPKN